MKSLSVKIAGRKYFVDIKAEDEELMRRAAKKLNDRFDFLSKKYDCSSFDHMAMAALLCSIENEETKEKQKYSPERQELEELAESVKKALQED